VPAGKGKRAAVPFPPKLMARHPVAAIAARAAGNSAGLRSSDPPEQQTVTWVTVAESAIVVTLRQQ